MGKLVSLALASVTLLLCCPCAQALAEDWSYESQVFERPSSYPEDMMCGDPDWSDYSIDEFMELDFGNFADNVVPDYTLSEEQLAYLEDNHPTVIYRSPAKADEADIAPIRDDDGLIALTRRVFEEEGMPFHTFRLV